MTSAARREYQLALRALRAAHTHATEAYRRTQNGTADEREAEQLRQEIRQTRDHVEQLLGGER